MSTHLTLREKVSLQQRARATRNTMRRSRRTWLDYAVTVDQVVGVIFVAAFAILLGAVAADWLTGETFVRDLVARLRVPT